MRHGLNLRAFVARKPDENHEGVYRWLLERNLKLPGVCFAVDALGDIYLNSRVPVERRHASRDRSAARRGGRDLPTTASM